VCDVNEEKKEVVYLMLAPTRVQARRENAVARALERKRLRQQQQAGEVEHGGSGGSGGDFAAPTLTAAVESSASGESTSHDDQLSTIEECSERDKQSSISDQSSIERIEEGVVRVAPALFVPPISFTFDKKAPRDRRVRRGVARAAATELELGLELQLAESALALS
jgi:hypothetical protein